MYQLIHTIISYLLIIIVNGKMYMYILFCDVNFISIIDLREAKQLPAVFQGFSTIQIHFFCQMSFV